MAYHDDERDEHVDRDSPLNVAEDEEEEDEDEPSKEEPEEEEGYE